MDGCEKNIWGVAMVTALFQHSLFCDIDAILRTYFPRLWMWHEVASAIWDELNM